MHQASESWTSAGLKLLAIVVLAIATISIPVAAQTSRGTVAGKVVDASGAVVADAVVDLIQTATGTVRSTKTNAAGLYRFESVDPGTIDLKVRNEGFATFVSSGALVEGNRTTTIDVALQIGRNETQVKVNALEEALLQQSPLRGENLPSSEVERLPLNALNPISLTATLPGSISPSGSTVYGIGGQATQFAVNGARPRSNSYLLDGTDNNDLSFTGTAQTFNMADAVQEVSVQTSDFGAEFGRAGGAIVNVITRSGTNSYHGSAFWQYGSQAFNSLSNLDKLNASSPPRYNENIYGFSVGGPIRKNKTFFFAALQQDRFRSGGQFRFVVPTAAAVPTLRSLFSSNPRLDLYLNGLGDVRGIFNIFPIILGADPVTSIDRGTITFGTAVWPHPAASDETQGMFRLDHLLSSSHQISLRYLGEVKNESPLQNDAALAPSFPGYFADSTTAGHNFLASDTYTVGTTLTNELRLSYARNVVEWPISSRAVPEANTLPAIQLPAPLPAPGIGGAFPQFRFANNWLVQETQSKQFGRHTFRYGFELLFQFAKQRGAGFAGRGIVSYTASPGYSAFANFLDDFSGPSATIRRNFGNPVFYPDSFRQSYFFQDTWRPTSSLTLTAGLRYENPSQPANAIRYPAFAGFDPNQFLAPNHVDPSNKNFGPSVGVAWSPRARSGGLGRILSGEKSVWKAGYQVSYDAWFTQLLNFIMGDSPNTVQVNTGSPIGGRGTANWSSRLPVIAVQPTIRDGQLAVLDPHIRNSYTERWSVGLQRTLPGRLLLDLAYVGSESHHLLTREDMNPQQLNGIRLHPGFGPRVIRSGIGNAAYHSLQLQAERRFAAALKIRAAYTWSRALDSTSESLLVNTNSGNANLTSMPASEGGLKLDRGLSDYNRSHRLTIAYIWDIPGPRRTFARRALADWSIAGITTFQSGAPYTVQNGFDRNNDGFVNDRPDIGNPNSPLNTRAIIAPRLGPSACSTGYVNPDSGTCVTPDQVHFIEGQGLPNLRTVGRNTLFAGGTNNWDVAIAKSLVIAEHKTLEFRCDAFNAFNHRQFVNVPSRDVLNSPPGQFLNPRTTDGGIRTLRMQLKFRF